MVLMAYFKNLKHSMMVLCSFGSEADMPDDLIRLDNGIAFVIFGVTGDLTRRKLSPALYEFNQAGRLPKDFYTIGFARQRLDR